MDVATFYALFSATCFTLVGLWWGVVQRDLGWVSDTERRRGVEGVHLAFLLPALMGLFAQIGGTTDPALWRTSFVVIALVGCLATVRLLTHQAGAAVTVVRAAALAVYANVALVGLFPAVPELLGLRAIQVEAMLLVLLVALGHLLVWWFLTDEVSRSAGATRRSLSPAAER